MEARGQRAALLEHLRYFRHSNSLCGVECRVGSRDALHCSTFIRIFSPRFEINLPGSKLMLQLS